MSEPWKVSGRAGCPSVPVGQSGPKRRRDRTQTGQGGKRAAREQRRKQGGRHQTREPGTQNARTAAAATAGTGIPNAETPKHAKHGGPEWSPSGMDADRERLFSPFPPCCCKPGRVTRPDRIPGKRGEGGCRGEEGRRSGALGGDREGPLTSADGSHRSRTASAKFITHEHPESPFTT